MSKVIDEVVFKKAIAEVLQVVADNTFDFVEYTEDEVSNLFDGAPEDIDYYSSLISDTLVSENRIFSSKHVTELLQQFQLDANAYADEIATRNLTTEIVTATSEVTKENVLYLILSDSSTNTYEQYMLIGGNATPLGSTKIDLSDVYTKSEIDTKLGDKANSSEVLAVNKVQTTTGSETNDTVYSSKLTKDELDKKANDDEVVKKTDIATTIDNTSTDTQVPSAKVVNTELTTKANASDLTTHTDDTNIHVTTADKAKWNGYNDTINEMKTNFQDGVNTIYDSVVARGVTPIDKSPSEISNAIANISGDNISIEFVTTKQTIRNDDSSLHYTFENDGIYIVTSATNGVTTSNFNYVGNGSILYQKAYGFKYDSANLCSSMICVINAKQGDKISYPVSSNLAPTIIQRIKIL